MSRTPHTAVSLPPGERDLLLRAGRLLTGSWPAAEDLLRRTFAERDRLGRTRAPSALAIRLRLLTLFVQDVESPAPRPDPPPPAPHEPAGPQGSVPPLGAPEPGQPAEPLRPPDPPPPNPSGPPDPSGKGATAGGRVWHDDASGEAQPVKPLVESLTTLSPRDRALTVGRYYLSLTPAEIGTVIGMPADDVDATAEQIVAELRRRTHEVGGHE